MTDAGSQPDPLILDVELGSAAAAPLALALIERRGGPLHLDARGVEHIGAQCAQVLLSARKTWEADGAPFVVASQSAAFQRCAGLLGLSEVFNSLEEGEA